MLNQFRQKNVCLSLTVAESFTKIYPIGPASWFLYGALESGQTLVAFGIFFWEGEAPAEPAEPVNIAFTKPRQPFLLNQFFGRAKLPLSLREQETSPPTNSCNPSPLNQFFIEGWFGSAEASPK